MPGYYGAEFAEVEVDRDYRILIAVDVPRMNAVIFESHEPT